MRYRKLAKDNTMRLIADHRSPMVHHISLIWLVWTILALISCSNAQQIADNEARMKQILQSGTEELNPQQLSDIMEDFGQEIGGLMSDNIDKILKEEKNKNSNHDSASPVKDDEELEDIKRANDFVAKDAQTRIAATGKAGTGELAEFSLSDAYTSGKDFFVNKVNSRLQQAGSYIGSQMSSVTKMAPYLKAKLEKAPKALKKILSWPTFFKFKVKFNKVYKNRMAELYHQMIFLKTQTICGIHNMKFFFGKSRHLQKTTQYADITDKEYDELIGNDAKLADKLEDTKQNPLSEERLAKLRELRESKMNIFGSDMEQLFEVSKETSPTEMLARERANEGHERHKRDLDDDEEDEEGPMYSFPPMGTDDEGDDEEEEEEDDDLGGNHEAKLVDDFVNGFQHVDLDQLEAQMDAELDEHPDDNKLSEDDRKKFAPIDWSQHRCMPIIENQESCGFCYALVAATMSDFYICMWNLRDNPDARPRRLSGRFVSDCGHYLYPSDKQTMICGCRGGIVSHAIMFIREAGAMSFFGYESRRVIKGIKYETDECALPRPPVLKDWAPIRADYLQNVTLTGVERDDWATVDLFLDAAGPVMVNIRAWSGFKDYAGGIFDEIQMLPDSGKVHSMLIVGRDIDENGRVYYKLRNTHGIPWGERGYARITAKALEHYSTIKAVLMSVE